ncbi:GDSL-type esterase/lipase family protein [Streptomyces sp. NPDC059680]|uniref:GDSL-type esterase/lipase family protein n=1 Tax=Streptomyces sp. NPDC059680 TaxID=3346904 RepID=UPI00368F76A7
MTAASATAFIEWLTASRNPTGPSGWKGGDMPVSVRARTGICIIVLLAGLIALVGCGVSGRTAHSASVEARMMRTRQPASLPTGDIGTATSVVSSADAGVIVVIGASVSGGYRAAPGEAWPNDLARILRQAGRPYRVVNASIGASRLLTDSGPRLPSFLTREYKDALAVPGVGAVVLTDVINDIQQLPHQYDPAAIVAGLRSFVARAHIKGVKVIGATIPPYGGFVRYEAAGERCRRAVNHAIRRGRVFDGVIDFDAALRDPADHTRIQPGYDSGDHLHPNNAGHEAMARAVSPSLFALTFS